MSQIAAWEEWRHHVCAARSVLELRRRLLAQAEQLGGRLRKLKSEHTAAARGKAARRLDEWKLLGIEVKTTDMPSSGAAYFNGAQRLVLVSKTDPPLRQRFTVAHEIGHLLLRPPAGASGVKMQREHEEALCDEFASRLLIPAAELRNCLGKVRHEPQLMDLLALCKDFSVGLHPMLIALRQHLRSKGPLFIAASHRGHPSRPDVRDYRVDAAAYPVPFYVAKHQRLRSLGLGDIATWAHDASEGSEATGLAEAPQLKLWSRTSGQSGAASGPAEWNALKLRRSNIVLIRLATQQLDLIWPAKEVRRRRKDYE